MFTPRKRPTGTGQSNQYLALLRRRLAAVAAELERHAAERAGSRWLRDRIDEAHWITGEIERLVAPLN